CQKYSSTPLIF
nr:immunoglobulin light chain junction region [Macaca mulatta]